MEEPVVIQTPKTPQPLYYLEYEDRSQPLRAYLYPCSEFGVAKKDSINNPDAFLSISSSPNFLFKGIKELQVDSRRLLMACSCKYVFFFDSWETTEQHCPNCNRFWKADDLLN